MISLMGGSAGNGKRLIACVVTLSLFLSILSTTLYARDVGLSGLSAYQLPSCDVTQEPQDDGFGSQFQNIVASHVFSVVHGLSFCATPISAIEHNYNDDPAFLENVKSLISLPFVSAEHGRITHLENKKAWLDNFLREPSTARVAKRILTTLNRDFVIHNTGDPSREAVVHVRKRNMHDNDQADTYSRDHIICSAMRSVLQLHEEVIFHVHSQGRVEDFGTFQDERIILHLDAPLREVFTDMVHAKILITTTSSLSYSAALLSQGEIWAPNNFWHTSPPYWKTYESKLDPSTSEEYGERCL